MLECYYSLILCRYKINEVLDTGRRRFLWNVEVQKKDKNYFHFRDYLNDNGDVALLYQKLKEELESKYADDRVLYTNAKQDIINKILNE